MGCPQDDASRTGEKICVVGLGYVGLPVAVALSLQGFDVVGFDVDKGRIQALRNGVDHTREVSSGELLDCGAHFTDDIETLSGRTFFIVTVPTPVDENRQPDLRAMMRASRLVGSVLERGACVVYESTVYPGVTEELCRPILADESGLRPGADFTVGYSPERINPGDKEHTLARIVKVVSGEDAPTLDRVAAVYGAVVTAGVHRASSIRVAEAAKVIENTQRDLNIALMNELAIIFDRIGIPTHDVLAAARTKWNFLPFTPGLVGGHCIGVDPYYLTAKAEQMGYHPEVILAGRRINDGMGRFIAQKTVKLLIASGCDVRTARVAILGATFKENVPDIRNSRVIDIVRELTAYGVSPIVSDPIADPDEFISEYGIDLVGIEEVGRVDAIVVASPHRSIVEEMPAIIEAHLDWPGVVVDVKSALRGCAYPPDMVYWAL